MKKFLFAAPRPFAPCLFMLCLFILTLFSGTVHAQFSSCSGDDLQSLVVENVQFRFVKGDTPHAITIGTIRNTGKDAVENVQIETQHLDAGQRPVDVQQSDLYRYGETLAPGKAAMFRLVDIAAQPESSYVSHQTRVVSANCWYGYGVEDSTPAASAKLCSRLPDYVFFLLGFAVFLLVLVFGVRRIAAKQQNALERFQFESLALSKRMAESAERNSALLERIAQALEERNKS
jgi:hypothetical protein